MAFTFATGPLSRKGWTEAFKLFNDDTRANHWKNFVREVAGTDVIRWEYVMVSGLSAMRELAHPGAEIDVDIINAEARSVYLQAFGLAFELNEIQKRTARGELANLKPMIQESRYMAMENSMASMLRNGTNSSYPVGYDSLSLANSAHLYDGGTASNISTAATLSHYSLAIMKSDVRRNHKTKKGEPYMKASDWNLIVPPELEDLAYRILDAKHVAGSNNNDPASRLTGSVHPTPGNQFISNATAYWMIPTGRACPLIYAPGPGGPIFRQQQVQGTINDLTLGVDTWVKTATMWQGVQYNAGA